MTKINKTQNQPKAYKINFVLSLREVKVAKYNEIEQNGMSWNFVRFITKKAAIFQQRVNQDVEDGAHHI